MPANRPAIPKGLERRLMIEAGHRCAIPLCKAVAPLTIDHIVEWEKVRRHEFENMIVLCASCHGRKGNGRNQIDRKSLLQYKANLAVLNSRYSDLERRAFEHFARLRERFRQEFGDGTSVALSSNWVEALYLPLHGSFRLMMLNLLQDGYVTLAPHGKVLSRVGGSMPAAVIVDGTLAAASGYPEVDHYHLTARGVEFLEAWLGAQPFEGQEDVAPSV